jgi:hypothetical protein
MQSGSHEGSQMNGKIFVAASVGLVALAVTATTPAKANFVAAICNDGARRC